ncbi:MAG: antibiotic biosynthesis monooxygenase [Proteobacteria bacterium]|nr:antibiotic biosynthesis monooxygenase [Pseudomonadota bacterium]
MTTIAKHAAPAEGRLAVTVTWEAKEGEADAVAEILRRMASAVRAEPGTLMFWPHRSASNDRLFFLYELYKDEAAFAAHQETEHFKSLILGQALAKLARRERVQFVPMPA